MDYRPLARDAESGKPCRLLFHFDEFVDGPRHVFGWPVRVGLMLQLGLCVRVRLTQAFGFMLMGALLKFFVIDGP